MKRLAMDVSKTGCREAYMTRRSTRWEAFRVSMAALMLAAFYHSSQAVEIGPTPLRPGTMAPVHGGATAPASRLVAPPTGPRPTTMALPPNYVGPTADITAVANAISCTHKSLTITCTVKPGLALTKPVIVGFGFMNSAGVSRIISQYYASSTGNQFVFNDIEWNGQQRRVGLNFSVIQDKLRPGDRGYSLTVPLYLDLDPLYDITISPMQFTLLSGCALIGDDNIKFEWYSPDGPPMQSYSFRTRSGRITAINQFGWARAEVSRSANLHYPVFQFEDTDLLTNPSSGAWLGIGPSDFPLLPPSPAGTRVETLGAFGADCSASVQWTLAYTLRRYGADTPAGTVGGPLPAKQ